MSESKHTPGPWKEVGAFVMTEDESIDICSSCNVNHLPLEEAIANAKLIAAAPALLAACKEALISIQEVLSQYGNYDEVGRRTKLPIEQSLEAAIRRAKKG